MDHFVWSYAEGVPELALRLRPIREHWEARGPGLLHRVKLGLPWLSFQKATVQLAEPVHGGGGCVLADGEIQFEAVLANPFPQLPEVARLAWLYVCASAKDNKAPAAFIPIVLEAAEYVELLQADLETTEFALKHWLGEPKLPSASALNAWWQAQRDSVSSITQWQTAVKQLS